MSRAAGIAEDKLTNLSRWRESVAYSHVERLALEYTETMCATPALHRPDLQDELLKHLTDKQLVELTTAIAWENFRARFNRAYGIGPHGYSEGAYCVLPSSQT